MKRSDWLPYLKTLRRIPDEIILDMGTREFEMGSSSACVCGWALRAALAPILSLAPHRIAPEWDGSAYSSCQVDDPRLEMYGVVERCVNFWGGTHDEWYALFTGVIPPYNGLPLRGRLPEIERAFVERLNEAVR